MMALFLEIHEVMKMKHSKKILALVLIFSLLQCSPTSAKQAPPSDKPIAVCTNGKFIGKRVGDVFKWLGVPYAKPPLGAARWKTPTLPENSKGEFKAQDYAKMPLQAWQPFANTTEDCLRLNVYTGSDGGKGKPVIVILAPSAFCYGGACLPYLDATSLVEIHPEIVIVCLDTRLGVMASLPLGNVPGAEEASDSTILWLLDTRTALQWVKQNIKSFGGDPNNITLLGVSAGATTASLMPILPGTRGLFHKIILESGNPAIVAASEERARVTEKLMALTNSTNMENLLTLSEEELSSVMPELDKIACFELLGSLATPQEVYDKYGAGVARGIPMLIGTTRDECAYFKAVKGTSEKASEKELQEKYKATLKRLPAKMQKVASQYISRQKKSAYENFFTDTIFRAPALLLAQNQAPNAPTYLYRIDFTARPRAKAHHVSELAYLLDTNSKERNEKGDSFARTIQEMWINFAKKGIPSTDYYRWPQYTKGEMLVFGSDGAISVTDATKDKTNKLLSPLLPYTYIMAEEYFKFNEETYKRIFGK